MVLEFGLRHERKRDTNGDLSAMVLFPARMHKLDKVQQLGSECWQIIRALANDSERQSIVCL